MRFAGAIGLLLLVSACTTSTVIKPGETRIALVIGNAEYKYIDSLRDVPEKDAWVVHKTLKQLGFIVTVKYNLGRREMEDWIKDFIGRLSKGKVGLFYYSGHGIQVNGENYIIPIDGNLSGYIDFPKKEQLAGDFVRLDEVVSLMEYRGSNNIIILDACRDNPFGSFFKSPLPNGLAELKTSEGGTLIAYATEANQKSSNKPSKHGYSIYTNFLIEEMLKKKQSIGDVFDAVRHRVYEETNKTQKPVYWQGGFPKGFMFNTKSIDMLKPLLRPRIIPKPSPPA